MLVPIQDLFNGTVYVNPRHVISVVEGNTNTQPCTIVRVMFGEFYTSESVESVANRLNNVKE